MQNNHPELSIVVPIFNEAECLRALHGRLEEVVANLGISAEFLFVDDGSRDASLEIIKELAEADRRIRFLSFSRNFGHEAATTAGLEHCRGKAVVLLDGDLQDPPEVIPALMQRWLAGDEMVYARRRKRHGETWFTRATSYLFYRLLARISPAHIPVDTGDFRLMDAKVVAAFCQLPERSRFVRGLLSWPGFKQSTIEYDRDARFAGTTKYNFWKRLRLAIDAFCGMSTIPLEAIGWLGGISTAGSLAALFAFAWLAFIGTPINPISWLALAIFFLAGVQLLALGLVGEYVGRIHRETQARPNYIIREMSPPTVASRHESFLRRAI